MLTEVTVRGFKAIKEATVALQPLTLFIGRNGSGKSSFVEALQWLQDAAVVGLNSATTGRYQSATDLLNRRSNSIGIELWYEPERKPAVHYMLTAAISQKLGVEGHGRPIVDGETCVVGRTSAARKVILTDRAKKLRFRRIGTSKGGRPLVVVDRDTLGLKFARDIGTNGAAELAEFFERAVFLRLSPAQLATPSGTSGKRSRRLLAEDGSGLPDLIASLDAESRKRVAVQLSKLISGVTGLGLHRSPGRRWLSLRERMKWRGGNRVVRVPADLWSEGTRRIVAILAILETRPSLFVIEEVENGLDPWTLESLLDALRDAASEGTQVLLTTHSPFLLDHVDPSQVVHVKRARGHSTYERIQDMSAVVKFEGVLAPGAMYLSKILGE